jgi:hypothetical protein
MPFANELRSKLLAPRPGALYEPRAFWSTAFTDESIEAGNVLEVDMDREHFYNSERFPVTITHLTFSPMQYRRRTTYDWMLQNTALRITAPGKVPLALFPFGLAGMGFQPSWDPSSPDIGSILEPSGIFSVYRWGFIHPLALGKNGLVEIGFGQILQTLGIGPQQGEIELPVYVSWRERANAPGAFFPGNERTQDAIVRVTTDDNSVMYPTFDTWVGEAAPTPALWPPASAFRARDFAAQNMNAAGTSMLTGFSVAIDMIEAEYIATSEPDDANNDAMVPVGDSLPARARMASGGTGAWWWRQGAPLALVSPTRTHALVYELPVPVTLEQGDSLDVTAIYRGCSMAPSDGRLVGMGACGFATIEG